MMVSMCKLSSDLKEREVEGQRGRVLVYRDKTTRKIYGEIEIGRNMKDLFLVSACLSVCLSVYVYVYVPIEETVLHTS